MKTQSILALSALTAMACATNISGPEEEGGEMVLGAGAAMGTGTGATTGSGGAGSVVGVGTGGAGTSAGGLGTVPGAGGLPTASVGGGVGVGGTPGAGGAPVGPATCTAVGWSSNAGYGDNGTMCGYAWTATNGEGETITPPCGGGTCFVGTDICASGTIPAEVPATSTYPGVMIGWNVSQPIAGGAAAPWIATGAGLTVNFAKGGATGQARVVVQVGTAGATTDYCANATSGVAIPWASFSVGCWAPGGAQLAAGASVVAVALQITSAATAQTFTNLCLNGVTLN